MTTFSPHKFSAALSALALTAFGAFLAPTAHAQDLPPNALIEQVTTEVLTEIKNNPKLQAGDISAATEAVNRIVMPNVNFRRMTAAAVGPAWRNATPEQRNALVDSFETMLIRTYAGSLDQIGDLRVAILPMRAQPAGSKDALVRSEIRGGSSPIQLDYRLEQTPGQGLGWKIYNVSILGAWIVDSYRTQFTQEINTNGIDGLIKALREQNFKADAK